MKRDVASVLAAGVEMIYICEIGYQVTSDPKARRLGVEAVSGA